MPEQNTQVAKARHRPAPLDSDPRVAIVHADEPSIETIISATSRSLRVIALHLRSIHLVKQKIPPSHRTGVGDEKQAWKNLLLAYQCRAEI